MAEIASIAHNIQESHLINNHFTPLRAAGQPYASTRIDTEGRRSRFHSPPPPPGASPSLLLPTPRRHVSASTSPTLINGDVFSGTNDSIDSGWSPLKAPVFDDQTASSSQNHLANIRENVIHLHKWYLKFKRVSRTAFPASTCTEDLSHWIVAVGTRVESGNDVFRREKKEPWRSSPVHKRTSISRFETSSGSVYVLVGPCDIDQTSMRTCPEFAASFTGGLPENWVEIVAAEACRLKHVQKHDDLDSLAPESPPRGGLRRKGAAKRRSVSSHGSNIVSLSRRGSEEFSSLPPSRSAIDRPRKKPRCSQEEAPLSTRAVKGISRELQQLQTSKLGNLALVEAAILEVMSTPDKRVFNDVKKKKTSKASKGSSQTVLVTKENAGVIELRPNVNTPLRSSNRACNGTREWWKVSSQSNGDSKDSKILQMKPSRNNRAPVEDSPGTQLAMATDVSDSEEEYKCGSSSQDEVDKAVKVESKAKTYTRKKRIPKVQQKFNVGGLPDQVSKIVESLDKRSPSATPIQSTLEDYFEVKAVSREEGTVPPAIDEQLAAKKSDASSIVSPTQSVVKENITTETTPINVESLQSEADLILPKELPALEAALEPDEMQGKPVQTEKDAHECQVFAEEEQEIEKTEARDFDKPPTKLPDVLIIDETDELEESLFYFSD